MCLRSLLRRRAAAAAFPALPPSAPLFSHLHSPTSTAKEAAFKPLTIPHPTMPRTVTFLAAAVRHLSTSHNPAPPTISVKAALDSAASPSPPLVRIQGWVRSVRRQKQLAFIELCDGSTSSAIQLVLPPAGLPTELFMGSSVVVHYFLLRLLRNSKTLFMLPDDCSQRPRAAKALGVQKLR